MSASQIRSLTADEMEAVSGGLGWCIQVDPDQTKTVIRCSSSVTEDYINAFLDGVEQGKKKGQKQ